MNGGTEPHGSPIDYVAVQDSNDFQELKTRFRRFVFPLSVAFLVWFLLYVLLAAYAHDFMAKPLYGNINVGIVLGLGQFLTTFVITMVYVRFANRRLDPISTSIRADLESKHHPTGSEGI